jgi:hypothetical protein
LLPTKRLIKFGVILFFLYNKFFLIIFFRDNIGWKTSSSPFMPVFYIPNRESLSKSIESLFAPPKYIIAIQSMRIHQKIDIMKFYLKLKLILKKKNSSHLYYFFLWGKYIHYIPWKALYYSMNSSMDYIMIIYPWLFHWINSMEMLGIIFPWNIWWLSMKRKIGEFKDSNIVCIYSELHIQYFY